MEKLSKQTFDNAVRAANMKFVELDLKVVCPYCGGKGNSPVACNTCDTITSSFRTPFAVNKPAEDKPVSAYQRLVQQVNAKFSKVISSKWCKL